MKSKRKLYYLEWEPALYLKRTMWLAPLEDLLYRRLIDAWWMNQGLPSNAQKLAGFARFTHEDFVANWPNVKGFFYVKGENGEELGHKKLEELLKNCLEKTKTKSDSGKIGANKRWQKHGAAIATPMAKNGYTDTDTDLKPPPYPPLQKKQNAQRKKCATSSDVGLGQFEEFWKLQIRKVDKDRARSAWKNKKCEKIADEVILAWKIQKQEIYLHREISKVPYPSTWLNGRQWTDEILSEKPKQKGNGGYNEQPSRAQPPDISGKPSPHRKQLTDEEKQKFKKLVRQAKAEIKPDEEKPEPEKPPGRKSDNGREPTQRFGEFMESYVKTETDKL